MSEFTKALIFPFFFLLIGFAIAERRQQKALGWIEAWIAITGLGALFRFWMGFFPNVSDQLARGILVLLGIAAAAFIWRMRARIWARQNRYAIPVWLLGVFVLVRNLFPQVDVDSIAYHHNAILWFRYRELLPSVLQDPALTDLRFRMIGIEEFLMLPGVGKELMLYGGVLGGVLKWMTCLSVLAVFPIQWAIPRALSLFFILIDDHFFFSGTTTFVYVNPAFIGIVALGVWATWRAILGRTQLAPMAIAMGFCAAANKMFGVYFMLLFLIPSGIVLALRWKNFKARGNWKHSLVGVGISAVGVWSLYGSNLVATGTPFYPFPFGPFKTHYKYDFHFENFVNEKPFLTYLKEDRYKLVTYPGILAMKLVVVTLVPSILARLFLGWIQKVSRARIHQGFLNLSITVQVLAVLYSLLMVVMYYAEQRYHGRYARQFLGILSIGFGFGLMAFRRFVPRAWSRLTSAGAAVFGIGVAVYLIATIDTRYYNVVGSQRPMWSDIIQFLTKDQASRAIAYPPYNRLLEPLARGNLPMLEECFKKLSAGRFELTQSEPNPEIGAAFYAIPKSWSAAFFMPLAPRLDPILSVATPVPTQGIQTWIKEANLRYVITRISDTDPLSNRVPGWDLREALLGQVKDRTPICKGDGLAVFKLVVEPE